MYKAVQFYLLRMVDTAVVVGLEEEMNAVVIAFEGLDAVGMGFGKGEMLTEVFQHEVTSEPGAAGIGDDAFAIVESDAVIVGKYIEVTTLYPLEPFTEFGVVGTVVVVIAVKETDTGDTGRDHFLTGEIAENKTAAPTVSIEVNAKISGRE